MSNIILFSRFRYMIEPQSIDFLSCSLSVDLEIDNKHHKYLELQPIRYTNSLHTATYIALNNPYIKSIYEQEKDAPILIQKVLC